MFFSDYLESSFILLTRREALRVANLTPEQREQERLKKERDDRLLRAFAEGKKKEPLRVQRANKEALLKPTSPSIMSSGADDSIHSVDTSKPNLPFPNSKPCLPVSSSKASSILTNTNASAKGPVSTPTPIVSAVNSSSVISSPKSKTRNVWQEFSSSISSSSPSTVTNSPKSQNSPISSSSGVDSTATNNSPKSQNPPISNSSCRDSTTHNSPKSQNSPIFNSPVVDSTTNNSSTTQISPISNPPVVDSDAPRASLVEIAQPALATTASAQSTTASDPVRSTDPQSAGIPSAPPGLTVQTEARPIYPTVSVNSPSWFSPLVASPAIAPSAQAPISTTKPLALPLPTANPPTAVKPLSYSSLVTLGISTSISQNASPVKSNQQPSRIPTAPKKNPSPPRSAGSGSRQDSGNISKSNQQQATRTTNNSSTRVKTTRLLPPSLAPVEYCKCPPNNHVRMIVFPESFFCPISGEMMVDPVIDLDGITYVCASFLFKRSNQILHQFSVLTYSTHKERVAITTWLSKNQTSPLTRKPLFETDLRPNRYFFHFYYELCLTLKEL